MTTEAALLAAVAASPDDDLPRLVYADWLDENGQPVRAEFIRLQIEIAKKELLPRAAVNVFTHLWKRQQEILDAHYADLLGPLASEIGPHDFEFRRGLLEWVSLTLLDFLQHQDYLGSRVPPPAVRAMDAAGPLDELATCSHAALITELSVARTEPITRDGFGIVVSAELLAAAPRLPRLSRLDLEACGIGDDGVARLFDGNPFPALVDLDLSFNDLTDAGVIGLLDTGLPRRLRRLVLGGNPIGDQAAVELADRLGRSAVLENLNLRFTNIGQAGQAALFPVLGGRVDLF